MKKAIFLLMLTTAVSFAQTLPDGPMPNETHSSVSQPHYWTAERKIEVPVFLAAVTADAFFTHRNLESTGGVEHNPIVRPFVHGTAAQVGYFTGLSVLTVGGSYLLARYHHPRAAAWLLRLELASEIEGASFSCSSK